MAAKLFFLPFPTAFSSNGLPEGGALLYFYSTGTLTPTDVFTTSGLVTPHANPVVASGAGRFPTIYLNDTLSYRLIIKTAAGVTLDDIDPFIPGTVGGQGDPAPLPVWTFATGLPGTSVVVSGTYPTQTITVPRGSPGASGALADADYGDILVSGTGAVLTIDANAVSLAKMAQVVTGTVLMRNTAGTGNVEAQPVATLKTAMSLNNVSNTSDATKPVSTAQQAALDLKRNLALVEQTIASASTVTPTFADDMVTITAQAVALTLANPTGTAVNGAGVAVRIKDNGVARTIGYGTQYRALGVTLPTTTVAGKTIYLGMVWNSADTKFDVLAVAKEA